MKLTPLTAVKAARPVNITQELRPGRTGHSMGVAILGWYPGR